MRWALACRWFEADAGGGRRGTFYFVGSNEPADACAADADGHDSEGTIDARFGAKGGAKWLITAYSRSSNSQAETCLTPPRIGNASSSIVTSSFSPSPLMLRKAPYSLSAVDRSSTL